MPETGHAICYEAPGVRQVALLLGSLESPESILIEVSQNHAKPARPYVHVLSGSSASATYAGIGTVQCQKGAPVTVPDYVVRWARVQEGTGTGDGTDPKVADFLKQLLDGKQPGASSGPRQSHLSVVR